MPAFAAHFFYARKVYNELDKETQELIDKYRDFYDLGAQGPDIFFYYKPYKKNNIAEFGTNLHHKPARQLFTNAIKNIHKSETKFIKKYDSTAPLVYLLGVSTHFTLDSCFHPTINKICPDFNDHMILETEMDRRILSEEIPNRPPYKFKRNLLINYKVKMYGKELNLVYPAVSSKIMDEVVYQTNLYVGLLYSPRGITSKLVTMLSKKFSKDETDFSNLIIKKTPNHKYDNVIDELLCDYDKVVQYGVTNLKSVLANYRGEGKLNDNFNKNFE